jgi:acyl-CoA thioesterase
MNPPDAWQAPPASPTPDERPGDDAIAATCAAAMFAGDRVSRGLDAAILEAASGRAIVALTVSEAMLNGHDTCHGGVIFTLADTAFSLACNSHNQRAVAQFCSIQFLRPAKRGDRLIAESIERARAGRSGVYDTTVRTAEGAVIAEFRGHARVIEGKVCEGLPVPQVSA